VTDTRRITAGGVRSGDVRRGLIALTEGSVGAGIDVIQLRERDLDAGLLTAIASEMVALATGSRTRIVVNDRLDIALAAGAHGVHLRGDSIPPGLARSIAPPGFLIGRSVHGIEEARKVQDEVDYLIAGTVWATRAKPRGPLLGIDGVGAVVRATRVPVLGIGGVTLDRIPELARAGAAGCAAIGLFASDAGDSPRAGASMSAVLDTVVRAARQRYQGALRHDA
jgi:thiamine-phosphate pyrophosphorylase